MPPPPATDAVAPTSTPLLGAVIRTGVDDWKKYVKGTSTLSTSLALTALDSASEVTMMTTTASAGASSVSSSSDAVVVVPAPPPDQHPIVIVDMMPLLYEAAEVDLRYNDMRPTRD